MYIFHEKACVYFVAIIVLDALQYLCLDDDIIENGVDLPSFRYDFVMLLVFFL